MKNFNFYSFITLYGIIFILILYKIFEVPVTHDEVPTALFYSKFSFWQIMMYPDNIPNNHILNTLLAKCCIMIFGTEQWSIRLPNLLSFIIFGTGVFRILKYTLNDGSCLFLPAAILFLNPYLTDFFSLCRGYGMSTGILTLSLSYMISGYIKGKDKHIRTSLILSILASYANFTTLLFWVSNTIFSSIYFLRKHYGNVIKVLKPFSFILVITLAYAALIWIPFQKMQSTNEFQYWTSDGFYKETVLSLIHNWQYDSKFLLKLNSNLIAGLIAVMIIANLLYGLFLHKKKIGFSHPAVITALLLLLTSLINIIQTIILKTPNLNGRTALFFYPLISALIAGFFSLIEPLKTEYLKRSLAVILTILLLTNLASRYSLKSVREWSYDQNNMDVAEYLHEKYSEKPISLKTSWFFNPSFSFYSRTGRIPWIELHPYDPEIDINTSAEYYYIFEDEYKLLEPRFMIVYKFSKDRWLLKKKQ